MAVPLTPEQLVSNLARSDAVHDFDAFGPKTPGTPQVQIFDASVPRASTDLYDTAKALAKVLGGAGEDWRRVANRPAAKINNVDYRINSFRLKDDAGASLTGKDLADKMGIPDIAAFIVDVNHHGLLHNLKSGTRAPKNIFHLLTPEVINDPAGKTPYAENIFRQETGLNIIPCVEVRDSPIVFPGDEPFNAQQEPRALFYTKYTSSLSPIRGFPGAPLNVRLTIKDPATNSTVIGENSKVSNSVAAITRVLKTIYSAIGNWFGLGQNARNKLAFDIATKWLQKRSGDWLQAIAARDIRGRTFKDGRYFVDSEKYPEKDVRIPDDVPVYFVTHDQIACAYALMVGCNVIFLSMSKDDESFVFVRADAGVGAKPVINQAELQRQKDVLNGKIKAARQFLDGQVLDFNLNPLKDPSKISADAATIFTAMLERTYASECLEKYNELLNGLGSSDPRTQFSSLHYSTLEQYQAFDIGAIKKTPMYKVAQKWLYTSDMPNVRKGSHQPVEYYDFLVYIGTLADVTAKNAMTTTFKRFLGGLEDRQENRGKAMPHRVYSNVRRGFEHITNLIETHLKTNAIPEDIEGAAEILTSFSFDLAYLVDDANSEHLAGSSEEQVAQILTALYEEAWEQVREDSQELRAAASRPVSPDSSRWTNRWDAERVARAREKMWGGNGKPPKKMIGGEEESLDIQISHVDRVMPIIRRLNTIKLKSTTPLNNAFLLSPVVAILYGLEGSIEKLEGSPDLAMYGRYVALLKHMSNMITTNEHRQLAWEFLTSDPKHREQIAGLFGISKEDYMLTGMISFGISQFLFGNVPGEPTAITALKPGSLKEMWEASNEGTTMNYEQIVDAYQNLRKDVFSKISQTKIESPSTPAAPTAVVHPTAKSAPWSKRQSIRPLEPRTPLAIPSSRLVTAAAGRKTYRKKPKRSKLFQRTRRVRRPGLSKEFETQVSR